MDYACLGFNSVGEIVHVSRGGKEFCERCAEDIKENYKMVKVVDDDIADMLINADLSKWVRRLHNESVSNNKNE